MFSQSLLSDIRDRLPLSVFIGERIPLKKAGRNFKGLCPFHQEKSPSFMVSDEKQIYHCFGCAEGGDIFSFTMKHDGIPFAEAVKMLAARCGVTIPDDEMRDTSADAEAARRKKWLLRINQIALEWFTKRLHESPFGEQTRNYLISRGIKSEFFTQLNLGAADKSWDALTEHLVARKVPLDLAAELGLIKARNGRDGYYDFFRGRLMFPIVSARGEIIAFGGRTMDGEDEAKYLNSPDSVLFHKSLSLYGLDRAAEHIRRADQVLIVEGYMDVIGCAQAGIENVVAPLGTALTSGHLRMLMRLTRNIIVIFDGDDAGTRAALRSLPTFLELGLMPRVVVLPAGEDPDTLVRKEGPDDMRTRIARAEPLFEFFLERTVVGIRNDATGKVEALGRVVPILRQIADPAAQGIYRRRTAERLDIPEGIVRDAIGSGAAGTKGRLERRNHAEVVIPTAERLLMEILLQHPECAGDAFAQITPDEVSDEFSRTVMALVKDHLSVNGTPDVFKMLASLADPELERVVRAIAMAPEKATAEEAGKALADCVRIIKQRPQRDEMQRLNELIRTAEKEGNEPQLFDLLRRKNELAQEQQTPRIT